MVGSTKTIQKQVTTEMTALAVGSGDLEVLATPSMIAMMEQAAADLVRESLSEGQSSVGTKLAVEHTSASPVGETITACATVHSMIGRRIELTVEASDSKGVIGKGLHSRVVVEREGFMAKAQEKLG